MKFTRKLPSENKDISSKMQADGWKRLKEPPQYRDGNLEFSPYISHFNDINFFMAYTDINISA